MTNHRFIRQCQLRADAYCRAFGLDRVIVPYDEDRAIEELKTVASVCQPTPEAMAAVADAEEQWAIDWLMDPRPEPPQGVQCCIDFRFLFGTESYRRRTKKSHHPPIHGWPVPWYIPSHYGDQQPWHNGECLAYECDGWRDSDDEFCPRCARSVKRLCRGSFSLPREEVEMVARFVLKRPKSDKDLVVSLTGSKYPPDDKARHLCRVYAHMRRELEDGRR